MSHSITIDLTNYQLEINNACDHAISILNQSIECVSDDKIKNFFIGEINKIEKHKSILLKKYGTNETLYGQQFKIYKELDNLVKCTSNIINNTSVLNFLLSEDEKNNEEIANIVKEYGVIANISIENLNSNSIKVNPKNLIDEINRIRNDKIGIEKEQKLRDQYFNYIDSKNFDNDIKYELKKQFNNISHQELNDLFAIVESKDVELKKIDNLSKQLFSYLVNDLGFSLSKNTKTKICDDGSLRKTFRLRNNKNNLIDINIYGNLKISYKLGNYVGHACEKTTDKIINKLKELNYTITSQKIVREMNNEKPLYQAKSYINKEK